MRGIIGSFVRYVCCSLRICVSLGQHLLELRNFILLILSYLLSRYFVFVIFCVPQPPELVALQLSSAGRGIRSLFSTKWFWVFVSGGAVFRFFA